MLALPGYASPFTIIEPNADMLQILSQYAQIAKRCWKALILVALLLWPAGASGQSIPTQRVHNFEVLRGEMDRQALAQHNGGAMLTVRDIMRRDTLRLWVQPVTPNSPPEWVRAKSADRVAWCYADAYPDPRHLLPDAKMIFFFRYRQGDDEYLAIGPEQMFGYIEPHIDRRGESLYAPFLDR